MDAVNAANQQLSPSAIADRRMLLAYSGHLLTLAGKPDAADRALNAALRTDAADANALEELAQLRLAQDRRAEAVDILRRIARPGADPRVLYQLAEATRGSEDYVAFERRALETGGAKRQLVLYYAGPGNRPDEAERIARIEAARSGDIFAMDALAVALNATGKVSEAKAAMRRVLAIGTKDPEILAQAKQIGVAQ